MGTNIFSHHSLGVTLGGGEEGGVERGGGEGGDERGVGGGGGGQR